MPVNKNAFDRYRFLEHCFRNKQRRYNIDSLVDYVSEKLGYNISLRQIREDISNMKITFNAPIKAIKYDGNKSYYVYTDSDFSIFDYELTQICAQQSVCLDVTVAFLPTHGLKRLFQIWRYASV